jgi:hypothetical protein
MRSVGLAFQSMNENEDLTGARQERDLRAFAKEAGYKIVGVWKETASGAKDVRAQRRVSEPPDMLSGRPYAHANS